jgi:hypothetical protein
MREVEVVVAEQTPDRYLESAEYQLLLESSESCSSKIEDESLTSLTSFSIGRERP